MRIGFGDGELSVGFWGGIRARGGGGTWASCVPSLYYFIIFNYFNYFILFNCISISIFFFLSFNYSIKQLKVKLIKQLKFKFNNNLNKKIYIHI
jgi:hypothetical protein